MAIDIAGIFRSTLTLISPKLNATVVYVAKNHKLMNWNHPSTFVEKLIKLRTEDYNNNPLVKECADKYAVRDYLTRGGYSELLNPLLAVYDNPEEIEWNELPERFALKLNSGSGCNIICDDKSKLKEEEVIAELRKWRKQKYWLGYAEMQYKDVPVKYLLETFLVGRDGLFPEDYKIYCFNGGPKAILYISGRFSDSTCAGFFDTNWKYLGLPKNRLDYKSFDVDSIPTRPRSLDVMLKAAADLSKPFPFVRMDFYDLDGEAVFGEMTFSPAGGFDVSEIDIDGKSMGDLLEI